MASPDRNLTSSPANELPADRLDDDRPDDDRPDDDRIAIIGLGCRVPGADDPRTLWANLLAGVDSVRQLSPADLEQAGVDPDEADWVPVFGRLDALTDFDAEVFGYSDTEAALLDPQHRLFLETSWWALEDAGYDPARTSAQIGVFAGCGPNRYLRHHLLHNPAVGAGLMGSGLTLPEDWDELLAGSSADYLSTRVAYALGLTGPAIGVQTACSSSLVAVCQAAQSLLDYRCDLAVAGGAAVVSTRQAGYRYRAGGTLSADGVCRPFDAAATGQVFGNGAGAVVLKRLADAVADGDHCYAVLAGWAVTNDGRDRAGFSVPGVVGQVAAVAEAISSAGWDPADVGFIQGHGSGTAVGDAIEVDALTRALRSSTPRAAPCVLGSTKPNLGNLDAAAGVVGLMATALAVRHTMIPPTLHFTQPHPDVDLADLVVSTQARPFTGPARAGVSSFGLGGTNAHVVLEPAPARAGNHADDDGPRRHVLVLSAADQVGLRAVAHGLAQFLTAAADPSLADVAYTLAVGRRPLAARAAVTASTVDEAVSGLAALAGLAPAGVSATGDGVAVDGVAADGVAADGGAAVTAWVDRAEPPSVAGRRVPLPGYPFQRRRHWIDLPRADHAAAAGSAAVNR